MNYRPVFLWKLSIFIYQISHLFNICILSSGQVGLISRTAFVTNRHCLWSGYHLLSVEALDAVPPTFHSVSPGARWLWRRGVIARETRTHACHCCLPGTFSSMGRLLTTNVSPILIELLLFCSQLPHGHFWSQKRSSSCEHCSFQSELLAARNPNCEMCSEGPSCGRFLFNFQQVYWQNLAKSEG